MSLSWLLKRHGHGSLHLPAAPNSGFWSQVSALATLWLIRDELDMVKSLFPLPQIRGPPSSVPPTAYALSDASLMANTQSKVVTIKFWFEGVGLNSHL